MTQLRDGVSWDSPRRWRFLQLLTLCLASLTLFTSAYLYTRLHELSIQGCGRQNELRMELNRTLAHFGLPPRFRLTNCQKAWTLYGPAPAPQPYLNGRSRVEVSTRDVMDAVEFTAALLDCNRAYKVGKRVHVPLGRGWTFAISGDDMDRLRVEGCVRGRPRCTLWTGVHDRARLAQAAWDVRDMARESAPVE